MEFWNDISVGGLDLNDSNEFFARRHSKHEKKELIELTQEQEATQILNNENNQNQLNFEELHPIRRIEAKQPKPLSLHDKVIAHNHTNSASVTTKIITSNTTDTGTEVENNIVNSHHLSENLRKVAAINQAKPNNDVQNVAIIGSGEINTKEPAAICEGSRSSSHELQLNNNAENGNGSVTGQMKPKSTIVSFSNDNTKTFRAYKYVDEYQKRREYRLKKLELEEREKRKCIALPMPNFNAIHARALKQPIMSSAVMSPETPQVLKRSMATKEKLQKKLKEFERKAAERPPIVARNCDVLQSEPFKPKLEHHVTTVEPFDLKMTERLVERKHWEDERERERILRKELEDNQKQEEEKRLRKSIRENTVFKARPNPFKK